MRLSLGNRLRDTVLHGGGANSSSGGGGSVNGLITQAGHQITTQGGDNLIWQ